MLIYINVARLTNLCYGHVQARFETLTDYEISYD